MRGLEIELPLKNNDQLFSQLNKDRDFFKERLEEIKQSKGLYTRGRHFFYNKDLRTIDEIRLFLKESSARLLIQKENNFGVKTYLWWCRFLDINTKIKDPSNKESKKCPHCGKTIKVKYDKGKMYLEKEV